MRDPLAGRLAVHWQSDDVVGAYLATREIFPQRLAAVERLQNGLREALQTLESQGAAEAARIAVLPAQGTGPQA